MFAGYADRIVEPHVMTMRVGQVANRVHDLLMQSMRLQTLHNTGQQLVSGVVAPYEGGAPVVPQRGVTITQVCIHPI